ncbi:MAG: hypothetical protein KJ645_10465, partial [Planctomycetes bacterium]|nr:hypothetical protein [Planctomycetota bacterium]
MQRIIFILTPSLLAVLLVVTGYMLGSLHTQAPLKELMQEVVQYHQKLYLGELGDTPEEKRSKSLVYDDPESSLLEMDRYTWRVPECPTPFLGHAPQPGQWGSAYVN